jgi:hypothetical protein
MRVSSRNTELLGTGSQIRDMFQRTMSLPLMGPNEKSEVVVMLDYHWSHEAQPEIWTAAMTYAETAFVTVNGKTFQFPAGTRF